jgi:hypothetical protein
MVLRREEGFIFWDASIDLPTTMKNTPCCVSTVALRLYPIVFLSVRDGSRIPSSGGSTLGGECSRQSDR